MEYSDDDSEFSVDPDLRADDGSDVDYTDSDEEDRFRALEADVDAMYEGLDPGCSQAFTTRALVEVKAHPFTQTVT